MKLDKIKISTIISMIIICGGLLLLTGSFLMSLGIFLILFVIIHLGGDKLETYLKRRKEKQEQDE